MLHGSHNLGGAGPDLTLLLARCADDAPAVQRPAFAERLGQWLSWTGAISLASALSAEHPSAAGAARPAHEGGAAPATPLAKPQPAPGVAAHPAVLAGTPPSGHADTASTRRHAVLQRAQADFDAVRASLLGVIGAPVPAGAAGAADFAPYRGHCLAVQQAMHDAVAPLRRRLRAALAREAPALARLAAIDAVLDDTLAVQERSLLGLVPVRLQARFERLQRQQPGAQSFGQSLAQSLPPKAPHEGMASTPQNAARTSARDQRPAAAAASAFRSEMDQLLAAELAHRLLPARGLLDALRSHAAA